MGMWKLGQMDVWGIMGTLGKMGKFRTDELWAKWALGANAYLGKMGARKNEHQGK